MAKIIFWWDTIAEANPISGSITEPDRVVARAQPDLGRWDYTEPPTGGQAYINLDPIVGEIKIGSVTSRANPALGRAIQNIAITSVMAPDVPAEEAGAGNYVI